MRLWLFEAILMDRSFLSWFRLYDGSGDLAEQHISNFEIASRDTAHDESLLLKHFSASLSGVAFTWYTRNSINSCADMVDAFHRRFYSVARKVTYMELAATKHMRGKPFETYLARWRI